jgi:hypothetical protein
VQVDRQQDVGDRTLDYLVWTDDAVDLLIETGIDGDRFGGAGDSYYLTGMFQCGGDAPIRFKRRGATLTASNCFRNSESVGAPPCSAEPLIVTVICRRDTRLRYSELAPRGRGNLFFGGIADPAVVDWSVFSWRVCRRDDHVLDGSACVALDFEPKLLFERDEDRGKFGLLR